MAIFNDCNKLSPLRIAVFILYKNWRSYPIEIKVSIYLFPNIFFGVFSIITVSWSVPQKRKVNNNYFFPGGIWLSRIFRFFFFFRQPKFLAFLGTMKFNLLIWKMSIVTAFPGRKISAVFSKISVGFFRNNEV